MESVAALPWNQWQLSRGMGGRLRLESVATLVWNTQLGGPNTGSGSVVRYISRIADDFGDG